MIKLTVDVGVASVQNKCIYIHVNTFILSFLFLRFYFLNSASEITRNKFVIINRFCPKVQTSGNSEEVKSLSSSLGS